MKLTKENIKRMLPGQTLTVTCDDTSELLSVYETAKQTRRKMTAEGFPHDISTSCSGKTMTVVIRITAKKL